METGLIKGNINLGVFYWNNIKTTQNNNKVKGLNTNTALILFLLVLCVHWMAASCLGYGLKLEMNLYLLHLK